MIEPHGTERGPMEHALDLGRPELRRILDRYATRTALVVGPPAASAPLRDALAEAGWSVTACGGPGRVRCPLAHGGHGCYLRESADVAVVYVRRASARTGAGLLRVRCAADGASPAVIALEDALDAPARYDDGNVIVGARRSAATILDAIDMAAPRDPRVAAIPAPRDA